MLELNKKRNVAINMNKLSENIIKYRKQKGLTQAQLAEILYVSPQAISKWEKGGSPDALILPLIADALNVSIDELFGRDTKNDVFAEMEKTIKSNKDNEFDLAFEFGWQAMLILSGSEEVKKLFSKIDLDLNPINEKDNLACVGSKDGFGIASLTKNRQFLMLLKRSEKGYTSMLGDKKDYKDFFNVFANEKALSVIYYFLEHEKNIYISFSNIEKNTKIKQTELAQILDSLVSLNILTKETILDEKDGESVYMLYKYKFVLALLTLAKHIYENKIMFINTDMSDTTNS